MNMKKCKLQALLGVFCIVSMQALSADASAAAGVVQSTSRESGAVQAQSSSIAARLLAFSVRTCAAVVRTALRHPKISVALGITGAVCVKTESNRDEINTILSDVYGNPQRIDSALYFVDFIRRNNNGVTAQPRAPQSALRGSVNAVAGAVRKCFSYLCGSAPQRKPGVPSAPDCTFAYHAHTLIRELDTERLEGWVPGCQEDTSWKAVQYELSHQVKVIETVMETFERYTNVGDRLSQFLNRINMHKNPYESNADYVAGLKIQRWRELRQMFEQQVMRTVTLPLSIAWKCGKEHNPKTYRLHSFNHNYATRCYLDLFEQYVYMYALYYAVCYQAGSLAGDIERYQAQHAAAAARAPHVVVTPNDGRVPR